MSQLDIDDLLCEWSEPGCLYRATYVKYLHKLSNKELIHLIQHTEKERDHLHHVIVNFEARNAGLRSETEVTSQGHKMEERDQKWFNDASGIELVREAQDLVRDIQLLKEEIEALEVEYDKMEAEKAKTDQKTNN